MLIYVPLHEVRVYKSHTQKSLEENSIRWGKDKVT